jgi:hypothetical protein
MLTFRTFSTCYYLKIKNSSISREELDSKRIVSCILIFGSKRGKIPQNPILTAVVYTIFALNLNTNQQITCNFNLFIQKPSSHWRQHPSPTGGTTVLHFNKTVPFLSQYFDHKCGRLGHRPWSASCPASLAERTRWGTGFVLSWKLQRECRTAGIRRSCPNASDCQLQLEYRIFTHPFQASPFSYPGQYSIVPAASL